MVAKLDEVNTAVRLHSIINKAIAAWMKRNRPAARYGVVTTAVDPVTQKVQVRIGKDTNSMPAVCSPFMTPTLGSSVRLDGPDNDLFVTHVMYGGLEAPVTHTF